MHMYQSEKISVLSYYQETSNCVSGHIYNNINRSVITEELAYTGGKVPDSTVEQKAHVSFSFLFVSKLTALLFLIMHCVSPFNKLISTIFSFGVSTILAKVRVTVIIA